MSSAPRDDHRGVVFVLLVEVLRPMQKHVTAIVLVAPEGTKLNRIAFTDGEGTAYAKSIVGR